MAAMSRESLYPLPFKDPLTGADLTVSELFCPESGISIRGRFEIPKYAKLDIEQSKFLETFLRCRGVITAMERELGISYPTVKARMDALLQALDLTPVKEEAPRREKAAETKRTILEQLERGEITAEEAKARMKEAAR